MRLPDSASSSVKCPSCHSADVLPIKYGFPGTEMMEASMRGELVLGGCVIGPHAPVWFCPNCEARWDADGNLSEDET